MKFPQSFLILGCGVALGMEIAFHATEWIWQVLNSIDSVSEKTGNVVFVMPPPAESQTMRNF